MILFAEECDINIEKVMLEKEDIEEISFETKDKSFRPSVYYVYQPSDAAIASLHEMRGNELDLQKEQRIAKDEITSGMDELGVLLLGDDFAFWHGSQMTIDDARKLVEGENATSMQVAGSLLAAIVWLIKNPNRGYVEPEEIPFEEILEKNLPLLTVTFLALITY